jgi:hypothetical protein
MPTAVRFHKCRSAIGLSDQIFPTTKTRDTVSSWAANVILPCFLHQPNSAVGMQITWNKRDACKTPSSVLTHLWSLPFSPLPLWRSRQSQMLKHSLISVLLFVSSDQCALGTAGAQLRTCMPNADGDCNQSCIKAFGYPLSASPHLFISYRLLISNLSYLIFS